MTEQDARKLKEGNIVIWGDDDLHTIAGDVTCVYDDSVEITWRNGDRSRMAFSEMDYVSNPSAD